MRAGRSAFAAVLVFGALGGVFHDPGSAEAASARTGSKQQHGASAAASGGSHRASATRPVAATRQAASRRGGYRAVSWGGAGGGRGAGGGISCVPYARGASGIEVRGNGGTWWHGAAGEYARGQRPEPGAVFVFRSSGGMPSGHVAVVERQVAPREMLVHHANWGGPGIRKGTVMRGVSVVDVSERNDWTAVRVQAGYTAEAYGRTYATYGFIYDRPEGGGSGTAYAAAGRQPPYAAPAPRYEEVAEAPETATAAPRAARPVHAMAVSHRGSPYDLSVGGGAYAGR